MEALAVGSLNLSATCGREGNEAGAGLRRQCSHSQLLQVASIQL